jgi:hypothetical protein
LSGKVSISASRALDRNTTWINNFAQTNQV